MIVELQQLACREEVLSKKFPHHIKLDPELAELASSVYDSFRHHIHTPVALAAKHTDVTHKCTALLHAFCLENVQPGEQAKFVQSVFSLTCDMGTEKNIPEVKVPLSELQPLLVAAAAADLSDDMFNEFTQDHDARFLSHVIIVPGLQHLIDNILCAVHSSMPHFPTFLKQLRNIEALLRDRRRHFVMTCLKGTEHEESQDKFLRFGYSLYEGRWHEIIQFVMALSPLMMVLTQCWDEDKFGRPCGREVAGEQGDADNIPQQHSGPRSFDSGFLSRTLRSALFHCYLKMVAHLDNIPESFVSWASGCRCHEQWCTNRPTSARQAIYESHFGVGAVGCPMATRRAPELAAGRVREVVSLLASPATLGTRDEQAVFLSSEESMLLQKDLGLAVDHIVWSLEAKLRFWRQCPWILCSLAHHDPVVVQKSACDVQVS